MPELILDPIGYFLIRINQETKEIEVAFCKYDEIKFTHPKAKFGKNTINKTFSSKDPEDILKWIKENELISMKEHFNYLKKELYKAKECLEREENYIQD
ncbi:DUF4346 domain-containing protein [Candidatus Woesearchaeota archaeon]|nr:DUF4346 domain-containing protein [Candidatus Woesearchaeota archaeon]